MTNKKLAFSGTKQIMVMIAPYLGPMILSAKDEAKLKQELVTPQLQDMAKNIQSAIFNCLETTAENVEDRIFDCAKQIMVINTPYLEQKILGSKNETELLKNLQINDLMSKFFALKATVKITLEAQEELAS